MPRLSIFTLAFLMLTLSQCDGKSLIKTNFNRIALCSNIPSFLRKNTYLRHCAGDVVLMSILYNGTRLATSECQHQFQMRPWNCSSSPESLPKIVSHAFPQTAYLFAIHSAGVAYSLAHACSSGLIKNCKCQKKAVEKVNKNEGTVVEKTECAKKSIRYGIQEAERLLKNVKETDTRWLVDEHNKRAGRLAFAAHESKENINCRCHGVSGACAVKKCVQNLPKVRDISDFLLAKYKSAIQVGTDNYGKKLIPSKKTFKEPTAQDLVFLEKSPGFCNKNSAYGILGTKGRACNKDDPGPTGCKVLCCNRGFKTVVEVKTVPCNCKFEYCCDITCETCKKAVTTHICN
ncbi:protein Wnt-2-like [Hydractinia symbiolongicarpus]|uniref:protein Wnt-2-like n=1 Tax=Hydractinia symbiolongicarpus TaxID=13093 RepID=UPI00254CB879|nr:protein Wnt-2-like [Hydractinia symbiolongicarpus]